MKANQIARVESLAAKINEAKTVAQEDKARARMDAYMVKLMDAGVAPEEIIAVAHG